MCICAWGVVCRDLLVLNCVGRVWYGVFVWVCECYVCARRSVLWGASCRQDPTMGLQHAFPPGAPQSLADTDLGLGTTFLNKHDVISIPFSLRRDSCCQHHWGRCHLGPDSCHLAHFVESFSGKQNPSQSCSCYLKYVASRWEKQRKLKQGGGDGEALDPELGEKRTWVNMAEISIAWGKSSPTELPLYRWENWDLERGKVWTQIENKSKVAEYKNWSHSRKFWSDSHLVY